MDSASSLAYPGSRFLAGWWRQLEAAQPTALWVGHLFVHRVEALIESVEVRPVDPLALHVLQALAAPPDPHADAVLSRRLHLPVAAVQQLLRGMQVQDLVSGDAPRGWRLSERGRAILRARADVAPRRERRVFPFVERLSATGRRVAPPHFLPLAECPATAWDVDEGHRFDPHLLESAVAEPAAWRERYGFPTGPERVMVGGESEANGVWERVIVDRPQRLAVALAATAGHELIVFAADADGWKLHAAEPILRVGAAACDALPLLPLVPAAWEEAWRLWCRQRHLPRSEAEACRLQFDGVHLDVHAPDAFVQRLQAAKSDLVREEAGLLVGDGYVRGLALLRLHSTS